MNTSNMMNTTLTIKNYCIENNYPLLFVHPNHATLNSSKPKLQLLLP